MKGLKCHFLTLFGCLMVIPLIGFWENATKMGWWRGGLRIFISWTLSYIHKKAINRKVLGAGVKGKL